MPLMILDDVPFHIQILNQSVNYGDDLALTDDEGSIRYSELRNLVVKTANVLYDEGIRQGDSILLCLSNCKEYALIFLASALIGATISGISPQTTKDEFFHYETTAESKLLIHENINWNLEDYNLKTISLKELLTKVSSSDEILQYSADVSCDDVLIEPFSSGTSGTPKCVQLTHTNYIAATKSLSEGLFDRLSEKGRRTTLAVLPFYHGSGFWALVYCILAGHHSVIQSDFHPAKMLKAIQHHKVDVLNVVPSIINFLVRMPIDNYDISSLSTVLCGSSALGQKLSSLFMKKFAMVENLIQGYGMTEVVVLSHITPLNSNEMEDVHWGSCGQLLPRFICKIVDENGSEVSDPNEWGELCIQSDAVMKGYKNKKEEDNIIDNDGWLHTGDIVYRDVNDFFFVVDRSKDLIKVNGMQVAPAQLEDILLTHPDVSEVVVIRQNHTQYGEVPRALVVLKEANLCTSEQLQEFVNGKVSPYKQLRGGVEFVRELPKTASGKINRRLAQQLNEKK